MFDLLSLLPFLLRIQLQMIVILILVSMGGSVLIVLAHLLVIVQIISLAKYVKLVSTNTAFLKLT